MSGMGRLPRRPIAQGPLVPGTTLKRSYAEPEPGDLQPITLGDIVRFQRVRWDVVALHLNQDGEQELMLERLARKLGGPRLLVRMVGVPARATTLVARQRLLGSGAF